ncbi:hypothetical protein I4U23_026856 [Adineta vaga]|nr:hypothetical protein I4U23_026856 [Adineta vaga]
MDIQHYCSFSSLINNYHPNISTPSKFSLDSNSPHSLEKTTDSFITTYTSLQTILSQIQLKLATVFLQETEYLQYREQQIEFTEQSITKRLQQWKILRNEREELENEFNQIKDRLEYAVIQITKFRIDGVESLQRLFSDSHQIDIEISELLSESLASLNRSRLIIKSNVNDFIDKSNEIQTELTDRQVLLRYTQSSITLMLELINTLNQFNVEHVEELTMTSLDFEKQYHQFLDTTETTKFNWDIDNELNEIRQLEKEKNQLENDLLEQMILLENISTILDKTILK